MRNPPSSGDLPETSPGPGPRTMYDKLWDAHLVKKPDDGQGGGTGLLYIDRHLVHEVTSPQAFEGLRAAGRKLRCPEATLAVADHNVPTTDRNLPAEDLQSRLQIETLERNVAEFGVPYFPLLSREQGIVHVVGPEQGITLPGMTIVCGDSHTSTHGAFGSLAFGIGTSEVEHVMATQTLWQKRARNMRIRVEGPVGPGVGAKDIMLAIIAKIGTAGGTGYVVEYAGSAVRALDMAGRMTLCNMSIEAGARAGMVAPDEITFAYVRGRPYAPKDGAFEEAVRYWKTLKSDDHAVFDAEIFLDAAEIQPSLTWGTSPEDVLPITGHVPDPGQIQDPARRDYTSKALAYMGLKPGQAIAGTPVDVVFIGSCTNSRIEDLRVAASIVRGRKVAPSVRAMVVPGSGLVRQQAEQEGLDRVFTEAGFEWREAGCSMCLGMNPDKLSAFQRCASTSNRNFEGRQGPGGRTHLCSPAMAAAAAVTGSLCDVRDLGAVSVLRNVS